MTVHNQGVPLDVVPEMPRNRMQRLMKLMRLRGVAGRWALGTIYGPGRPGPGSTARMNYLWGPDGWVLAICQDDGRKVLGMLREQGVRRIGLIQTVQGTTKDGVNQRREVVRVDLSEFLDLLDSHMKILAQEGRLSTTE